MQEPFQVYRKFGAYLYNKYPKDIQRGVAVVPMQDFRAEAGVYLRANGATWFNELGTMQFLMLAYNENGKVIVRNPELKLF